MGEFDLNRIFKNRIVIAGISLALALLLGIIFYANVNSGAEKTQIVKVMSTIPKGTKITENMLKIDEVGKYNLGDVITDKSEVIGKFAKTDLVEGDLLLKNKISDTANDSADKLSQLNGSKSAISVTVKTFADGLSDKLLSGDIVSCIITDKEETKTPAELNYVEVLAVTQKDGIDKQSEKKSEEDTNKENVATVTLLADKKQAEILSNSDVNDDIHLALVYRGDEKTAKKFLDEQDKILKGE